MTLKLRSRHRLTFAVLGVLLPTVFVAGIVLRRAVPETAALSPELSPQIQTFTATGREFGELFSNSPVHVSLWHDIPGDQYAVGFTAAREFAKPDLLVYWNAGQPAEITQLPTQATLLGAFVAGPLVLPNEAMTAEGSLILYSLANQEVVDVSKPIRFAETER